MTTYIRRDGKWIDKETGKPMKVAGSAIKSVQSMSDIVPFKSPLDFKTEISSRSQLRDYEKRHGVRQIGTDFNSTYRTIAEQHKDR